VLDSHLDWVLAVRQLLQKAGLEGADLAASSVGASFAAEVAAIWPAASIHRSRRSPTKTSIASSANKSR